LLAIVAAAAALIIELLLFSRFLAPGMTWDPVSLWRQSTLGKATIAAPLVIPVVVFGVTFSFIYRRVRFYSARVRTEKRS
jgi:hypothetical protein